MLHSISITQLKAFIDFYMSVSQCFLCNQSMKSLILIMMLYVCLFILSCYIALSFFYTLFCPFLPLLSVIKISMSVYWELTSLSEAVLKVGKLDHQNESLDNTNLCFFPPPVTKDFAATSQIYLIKSSLRQNVALSFLVRYIWQENNEITSIPSAHKGRCLHPCCIMPFILFEGADKSVSWGGVWCGMRNALLRIGLMESTIPCGVSLIMHIPTRPTLPVFPGVSIRMTHPSSNSGPVGKSTHSHSHIHLLCH